MSRERVTVRNSGGEEKRRGGEMKIEMEAGRFGQDIEGQIKVQRARDGATQTAKVE